jgi:hypothetical protein
MGWTAPRTWVAGEIVTASIMNSAVRDNLSYIKGIGQVPTIQSGLVIDNSLGSEYLKLPLLSTAECATVLNAAGEVAYDEATNRIKMYGATLNSVVTTADVDDTPADAATTDPISSNWAYDHLNVLTAQASIPYATAARAWTELLKGTGGQYLKMNSGATAPEWAVGAVATKIKNESRAMDAVTGDVSYTGYGFTPKGIVIWGTCPGGNSFGFGDSSLAEMCSYSLLATSAPANQLTTAVAFFYEDATPKNQTAVLKTLDAAGFTLTWTRNGGTAAGTANFLVFAIG